MKYSLIAMLMLALPSLAQAEEIYPCDTSCTGLYSEARRISFMVPLGTTFSVIDVKTWEVGTYVADQRYIYGEYIEHPRKIETSRAALEAANRLQADVRALELKILIPPHISPTAHSVVQKSRDENRVSEYIAQNLGVSGKLGSLVGSLLEIFDKIIDINVVVDVEFEDGSSAKFVVTGLSLDGLDVLVEFELLDGSAVDSDGNNIPTSLNDITGIREFGGELNQDLFRQVAQLYGVQFSYGGCKSVNTTVCVQNGTSMSCTSFTYCF